MLLWQLSKVTGGLLGACQEPSRMGPPGGLGEPHARRRASLTWSLCLVWLVGSIVSARGASASRYFNLAITIKGDPLTQGCRRPRGRLTDCERRGHEPHGHQLEARTRRQPRMPQACPGQMCRPAAASTRVEGRSQSRRSSPQQPCSASSPSPPPPPPSWPPRSAGRRLSRCPPRCAPFFPTFSGPGEPPRSLAEAAPPVAAPRAPRSPTNALPPRRSTTSSRTSSPSPSSRRRSSSPRSRRRSASTRPPRPWRA